MISPPSTGPMIGASRVGTPRMDITRPIRWGPAALAMIVWPTGMIMPPPTPWSTRKKIRLSDDQASPHRAEPTVNRTSDVIQVRLAPNRSTVHPDIGMTMARARR